LKQLGVNALWLQPIHPRGIDGRQIDPATNRRFELGSPYAAKNYFAVMPLMASGFTPGSSPAANDTPQGRVAAPRTIYRRDARGMLRCPRMDRTMGSCGDSPAERRRQQTHGRRRRSRIRRIRLRSRPEPGGPAKLRLLWQQAGFKYSKFCPPVVADGKLLVPTFHGQVDVYELN
jgi:hypothetical protein